MTEIVLQVDQGVTPGLTYLELQDEVLAHQLNDTKYRPLVKRWLNEAQRRIALAMNLRREVTLADITLTADDPVLPLPTEFVRFIDLRMGTEVLGEIDLRDYDDLSPSLGQPRWYVVIANNVFFYPAPDKSYSLTLRFWKRPDDMVSDGDVPEVGIDYSHLLVRYALMRAFERENDFDAAGYWRGEWDEDMARMKGEVETDVYVPHQVEGMWPNGPYG